MVKISTIYGLAIILCVFTSALSRNFFDAFWNEYTFVKKSINIIYLKVLSVKFVSNRMVRAC